MITVITMAGLGSRFKKAGYQQPKYEIEVRGHSLFYWSMQSLLGLPSEKTFFIVRKEDHAKGFIEAECAALNIHPFVIEIDHLTSGQAETAMLASPYWEKDEALLIYNIDTYVEAYQMKAQDIAGDGWIPCFLGEGDHWSFVRLDEKGDAVEIREKKRISPHCTLGAYYFRTAKLYETLYNEYYLSGNYALDAGERYVAPLYNYLIEKKGGCVRIVDIDEKFVHVLGTPEEVEVFRREGKAQ